MARQHARREGGVETAPPYQQLGAPGRDKGTWCGLEQHCPSHSIPSQQVQVDSAAPGLKQPGLGREASFSQSWLLGASG